MKLENKVALITGGGTGIGREIALAFAREGAAVVINYSQSAEEARATAEECRALSGRAGTAQADISVASEVRAMVQAALTEFGRIDILVNNAGMTIPRTFPELNEEIWDRVMDVNLKGPFLCSQQVAPVMLRQKSGRIINISSVAAVTGSGSSVAYVIAKEGVIVLTKSLARELAPTVQVNCISPGFTETRWHAKTSPESKANMVERTLLKKPALPEYVARAALFFAADAENITGENLIVDGGASFWRP